MPTSPTKILLVDDREENLLALEAILAGLGHELLRATSGSQALKHLLVEDVSLILLDVQMPEMDGYETAAHIQSRPRTQDIPIIFLTAIDREAHQSYRGYAAGSRYLVTHGGVADMCILGEPTENKVVLAHFGSL